MMCPERAALRKQLAQRMEEQLRAVELKVQLLEKGGRGHPEHFLPKAEVPRLSESIQRLYK
jgi:hypothetical protein